MPIGKHDKNTNILHVSTDANFACCIPYFSVNSAVIKEVFQ